MHGLGRRALLQAATSAFAALLTREAGATLARGLSLRALARASTRALVAVPLAAECRWADFGGQRCIVTDTRLRTDQAVLGETAAGEEFIVRTLGGRIGSLGERVEGQPTLRFGEGCVVFLVASGLGVEFVTGMAQGHFPLRRDQAGVLRLTASRQLPKLLFPEGSAALALSGRDLATARGLVREAMQ